MLKKINQKTEAMLYGRGFTHSEVRHLMRNQLYLAGVSSVVLLVVTLLSVWSWSYASGALLITVNFWYMAKVAQSLVKVQKGAVFSLLFLFYGRLILTGLILYVLIAWMNASVVGLLAGLTTVVVNAVAWGTANYIHKVKEA